VRAGDRIRKLDIFEMVGSFGGVEIERDSRKHECT
jgi:hypothetical protein